MEDVGKVLGKAVDKIKPDKPAHPEREHPDKGHRVVYSELPALDGGVSYVDLDCVVGIERDNEDTLVHLCSGHSILTSIPPEDVLALMDDYDGDDEEV